MLLIPQGEDTGGRTFYRSAGTKLLKSRIPCYDFLRPLRRELCLARLSEMVPSPAFWDATRLESEATFEAAIVDFESRIPQRRPADNGG
jgi:hypothetical protein